MSQPIFGRKSQWRKRVVRIVRVPLPARATHVAGYVPPAGSIAWQFLGRVIPPRGVASGW